LSVANDHAILPIAFRLYLPEDWAEDSGRRSKAGVPADIVFKTKPQIALDQIRAAQADGVPDGVVLADAGYGINTAFRTALTKMGRTYVVGIQSSARLWSSGACCIETFGNVFGRWISFDHAIRTNFARPSWFIRLRDLTAIATSVARRASWRDFKVSPMTRL
jgi:hypothetical protein